MDSRDKLMLGITAIFCITVLEAINLIYIGIDGGVLTAIVTGIAAIVGAIIGRKA